MEFFAVVILIPFIAVPVMALVYWWWWWKPDDRPPFTGGFA